MMLIIINLCCNVAMTVCGLWIVTGASQPRLERIYCALIASGSSVNALGLAAALCSATNFLYVDIWPGEVIVNLGAAALMIRWAWYTRRRIVRTAVGDAS
jgi:hypothetical protein